MYSAISGMQGFAAKLDVIGNNIANVNTVGFKSSRVDFSDILSQTITGGSAPSNALGGTNPQQVGLGVKVSGIDMLFTQGADQFTGNNLDLAINGDGLFVVSRGGHEYYTRAGNFTLDKSHNLTLPNGAIAQGYGYVNKVVGGVSTSVLDTSSTLPMNLDSLLSNYVSSLKNTSDGTYTYGAPGAGNTIAVTAGPAGVKSRQFTLASSPDLQIGPDGSLTVTVTVQDLDASNNVLSTSTQRINIGNLALATFPNPAGLLKVGDSLYDVSNNSGKVTYNLPGQNNTGTVQAGFLEMSNVDLTREFTEMIVAQRGFDANSKIIGTANAILQDIVNLKNS
jgi:flagellar hook protein FlgE